MAVFIGVKMNNRLSTEFAYGRAYKQATINKICRWSVVAQAAFAVAHFAP